MAISGKYSKLSIHIMAWLCVGIMPGLQVSSILGATLPPAYWVRQLIILCLLVAYYYGNQYFFAPRLLLKNRAVRFGLLHLGAIAALQLLNYLVDLGLDVKGAMIAAIAKSLALELPASRWWFTDFNLLMTSIMAAGVSTSIVLVQEWRANLTIHEKIREKQVAAELALLKAQIHPHFFFNTLNNIYSLSYEHVEDARTSIYKLSRMMRYLLYETPNNLTLLSKEINFVRDYMELMKLRMTDTMVIHFEVPETVIDHPVSPMILLPFIENAFKHGVSSLVAGAITVEIKQSGHTLSLYVENKILHDASSRLVEDGGIGLTNTRRRLQMLYPDAHTLHCGKREDNLYIVELDIQL